MTLLHQHQHQHQHQHHTKQQQLIDLLLEQQEELLREIEDLQLRREERIDVQIELREVRQQLWNPFNINQRQRLRQRQQELQQRLQQLQQPPLSSLILREEQERERQVQQLQQQLLDELERRGQATTEEAEPQPAPEDDWPDVKFGEPKFADHRRRLLSNTNQNNIGLYVYKYVNNESNIFEKQGNIATLTVILRDINPMSQININDLYNKLYNYIYRIKDIQSDECLAGGYNTFNTNTTITFLATDPISIGNYCIHTCELVNNTYMVYYPILNQDKYIYVKKKELTKNENKLLAKDIYSNKTIDDKLKHIMNSSLKNKIGIIKYNIHSVKIIL